MALTLTRDERVELERRVDEEHLPGPIDETLRPDAVAPMSLHAESRLLDNGETVQ